MSTAARLAADEFLKTFFAPPNRLAQTSKPEIPSWAERVRGPAPQPTVLPCWRTDGVDWYGIAFDDRQLRSLGESLTAFVGPTYTTFRGQLARLNLSDPVELAVSQLTGGLAYKFRGADPKVIWAALERMRRVWSRRGAREQAAPEPIGRSLRRFYMALEAQDSTAAECQLDRLRDEYHLDGINLLYLRVQYLEAFRRWSDLLALSDLPDLLRLRRPVAVTEALLKAVYNERLSWFESPSDPDGALAVFRLEVFPQYTPLFAARSGMRSPEAVKAFMLLAAAKDPPDTELRDTLLNVGGLTAPDRSYLEALSLKATGSAPEPSAGDALALAAAAAATSDFDRAFTLAVALSSSPSQARLVCECAFELGTLEARSAAVRAVNALPDADRAVFLGRRVNQQLWQTLQDLAGEPEAVPAAEPVPTDWCGWLAHLDRTDGKMGSREIARRGATEWSVAEFLAQPSAVERFTGQLAGRRSQSAGQVLQDSLPHLVHFFGADPAWPNPDLKSVYRALLELLYFSTDGGRADLLVFNELLEAALTLGVNAAEYIEFISYVNDLWGRLASAATLDWAVDTLALLVAFPCPDGTTRLALLQSVLDRSAGFARLVGPDERELIRLLAADLGQSSLAASYFPPAAAGERAAEDLFAPLDGLTIAAYTLTERAAKQFQNVIGTLAPGVKVQLAHDLDASTRLKQLARQADLFVLVTASATHAATDCVRATRPSEKPTLLPAGKGAASMLAAVRAYCQERSV
jgi:hypothetical protein